MADEYEYQVYNNDTARRSRRAQQNEEDPAPPRKKRHLLAKLLLLLVILAAIVLLLWNLLIQPPAAAEGHRENCWTLLLAGTDGDGTRTDTMMLIYMDTETEDLTLLSIPRDTLVSLSMSVPKLNGVYGWSGSGEAGMESLMDQVELLLGYRPDGYVLVNFDAVEEIVDILGGVEFDVPVDMEYSDPSQDLYISLSAGVQTLTGEQALQVLRYRSGYAMADLDRISVQRDLVQAVASQCLSLSNVTCLPQLLTVYEEDVLSDLSFRTLISLAMAAMQCDIDNAATATLPGESVWYLGGSYYQIDLEEAVELLNSSCNPLEQSITTADLQVVNVVNGVLTVVGGSGETASAAEDTAEDTTEDTQNPAALQPETAPSSASGAEASTESAPEPAGGMDQTAEEAGGTDQAAEEADFPEDSAAQPAQEPDSGAETLPADTAEPDAAGAPDSAGPAEGTEAGDASGTPPESEILPTD